MIDPILAQAAAHYNASPHRDGHIVLYPSPGQGRGRGRVAPHRLHYGYGDGGGHPLTTREVLTYGRRHGFRPADRAIKGIDFLEHCRKELIRSHSKVHPLIEAIRKGSPTFKPHKIQTEVIRKITLCFCPFCEAFDTLPEKPEGLSRTHDFVRRMTCTSRIPFLDQDTLSQIIGLIGKNGRNVVFLGPLRPDIVRHDKRRIILEDRRCAICKAPNKYQHAFKPHIVIMQNGFIATIDHIIPRSLGGEDHDQNLQTLCRRCNIAKGNTVENPFGQPA